MKTIKLPTLTCRRCDHTWTPRKSIVTMCPRCKRTTWQTPKAPKAQSCGGRASG